MKQAVVGSGFEENIAQEIRELSVAVGYVQGRYNHALQARLVAPVERAEFLISELRQALGFLFDDEVDDENDAQLERLNDSVSGARTHDELAEALDSYAIFAANYRTQLAGFPEFDTGFIDEAMVVARRLREQSAIKASRATSDEQTALQKLRNRLITLMVARMRTARRAARYVFRNHPHVARRAASSYERRRKRARLQAHAAQPTTTETQNTLQTPPPGPTPQQPAGPNGANP
jgi:hypothetical protein